MEKVRKKRRGDRKEGRYLRKLDPYYAFTPFIMKTRSDASNYFDDTLEVTEIDRYLRRKRAEGFPGIGMLHLFLAAYIRTASQRPAINRFVSGQRIYARNDIELVMTVKKAMSVDAGETSIKVKFTPYDTIDSVYTKINTEVEKVKNETEISSTDVVAAALMRLPRIILRAAVALISFGDYFGLLPQSLLDASPFHGSIIITELGSLGIPAVYHHLYNFGNLPLFLAYGTKRRQYELQSDGTVAEMKYLDYRLVLDERICDGFYFAQAYRQIKNLLKNPEQLDIPPDSVVEDVG